MDSKEGKKKSKKTKVGVLNDSYEVELASTSVHNRVSPFLNNIRDVQSKNNNAKSNALEALVGAKKSVSQWRDYANRRRVRKKDGNVTGGRADPEGEKKSSDGLGLDDIHEDFVTGEKKIFGGKSAKNMSSASNRALLQYFAKLGRSMKDEEQVDLDFIESLINSGADVNCTDKHGQTLLHEVASKWHVDVARFLIDLGAEVSAADNYGRTPLHVAAADDYPDMIQLLIEFGADKEALTTGELQSPVHYAARNDATQALKILIRLGAEYKLVLDYKGRSPLHVASELDRSETARKLLELDSPAGISDNKGQAIITWMISKMPPVAAEAIEQFHVKDRPNRKQHYYLHLLVQDRNKDSHFYTQSPLQVAVKYKQFDILTHPVFNALLNVMWAKFGWWRAYGAVLFNLAYILLWTFYGVTVEYNKRYLYILPEHWWRIVLIFAAVSITVWQVIDEIRDYKRSRQTLQKFKKWREAEIQEDLKYCHPRWPQEKQFLDQELENLDEAHTRYFSDLWNVFDWICYTLLTAVIATHIADIAAHSDALARVHIRLTAIVVIFLWLRLMKNMRAFSFLGPFIVMLGAMFTDLLKFVFLYMEFYIPYVCAFYMIFGGTKSPEGSGGPDANANNTMTVGGFENFNAALFTMFRMTLVDEYAYEDMKAVDSIMADILVGTWLALSAVLCLNLFIALLSDTFQRVYDNAKANAVMQKAIMILSFWENMSHDAKSKFLKHIEDKCAPQSEYYDDDMTEDGESDLKKVTIQIKEDLDVLMEKWQDQFGDEDDGQTALEELRAENTPRLDKNKQKMVTTQKFQNEIELLRDEIRQGLLEMQKQQAQMMTKFRQDMKVVKSLLLDLTGQPGPPGEGGPGSGSAPGPGGPAIMPGPEIGQQGYYFQPQDGRMTPMSTSSRPKSAGRKKKKKRRGSEDEESLLEAPLPGEVIMQGQPQGMFAQSPLPAGQPTLEVMNQEFLPLMHDPYNTQVYPASMSHDHGHSNA